MMHLYKALRQQSQATAKIGRRTGSRDEVLQSQNLEECTYRYEESNLCIIDCFLCNTVVNVEKGGALEQAKPQQRKTL